MIFACLNINFEHEMEKNHNMTLQTNGNHLACFLLMNKSRRIVRQPFSRVTKEGRIIGLSIEVVTD